METPTGAVVQPTLAIVGAGRAGAALALAARDAGYRIAAVASRRRRSAATLAIETGAELAPTPLAAVRTADITLLTVPDGALAPVAATIAASGVALRGRGVVHTAARLGPGVLAALRVTAASVGVLHPLQALTGRESAPLLHGAYFRIEADPVLQPRLLAMVAAMGGREISVDAAHRDLYHAAAVLAGNAPLALLARATELLVAAGAEAGVAHAALAALLEGAARNARLAGPAQALTGPVVRGDDAAVRAHLEALRPYADARALYAALVVEMASLRDAAEPVAAIAEVA